jgi:hypothetical protein
LIPEYAALIKSLSWRILWLDGWLGHWHIPVINKGAKPMFANFSDALLLEVLYNQSWGVAFPGTERNLFARKHWVWDMQRLIK